MPETAAQKERPRTLTPSNHGNQEAGHAHFLHFLFGLVVCFALLCICEKEKCVTLEIRPRSKARRNYYSQSWEETGVSPEKSGRRSEDRASQMAQDYPQAPPIRLLQVKDRGAGAL